MIKTITRLYTELSRDEAGFVVSAELILVATICVLSMVVGLAEIHSGVNQELEDVASAVGSTNQSYAYRGLVSPGKSIHSGSRFGDDFDDCDSQWDLVGTRPSHEWEDVGFKGGRGGRGGRY